MLWQPKDRKQKELHRDEAWELAWSQVESKFSKAENYHNIEAMHTFLCKAAVATLKEVTEVQWDSKFRNAARRSKTAKFCRRTIQTPADAEGTPTTCWIRRLKNLASRLKELHQQAKTAAKYEAEGKRVSNEAAAQRDRLWINIANGHAETEPYEKWLVNADWQQTTLPSVHALAEMAKVAQSKKRPKRRRKLAKRRSERSSRRTWKREDRLCTRR